MYNHRADNIGFSHIKSMFEKFKHLGNYLFSDLFDFVSHMAKNFDSSEEPDHTIFIIGDGVSIVLFVRQGCDESYWEDSSPISEELAKEICKMFDFREIK